RSRSIARSAAGVRCSTGTASSSWKSIAVAVYSGRTKIGRDVTFRTVRAIGNRAAGRRGRRHLRELPVVLVRLSRVHADAMRDLPAGAWRLVGATAKLRAKKARAMSASVGDARLHEALDASVRRIGSFDRNTSLSAARMALFIRRARTILR